MANDTEYGLAGMFYIVFVVYCGFLLLFSNLPLYIRQFSHSLRSGCFLGERASRDRAAIELAAILDARTKGKMKATTPKLPNECILKFQTSNFPGFMKILNFLIFA